MVHLSPVGKLETCVQQKFRKKRQQGKWSPLYTAGPTGRTWHEGQAESFECHSWFQGQSSADSSPQEPVPGRKEEAGPLGTPAITCSAGAQWEAVAEERMIISPHSDPLERGGGTGNAASLLPIATRTLLAQALATPRLPSLLAVS